MKQFAIMHPNNLGVAEAKKRSREEFESETESCTKSQYDSEDSFDSEEDDEEDDDGMEEKILLAASKGAMRGPFAQAALVSQALRLSHSEHAKAPSLPSMKGALNQRLRDVSYSCTHLSSLQSESMMNERVKRSALGLAAKSDYTSSSTPGLQRILSEAHFGKLCPASAQPMKKLKPQSGMLYAIQTKPAVSRMGSTKSPLQKLQEMVEERGHKFTKVPHTDVKDWTPWNTDGYTVELTKAIRDNNVETIRDIHSKSSTLQCSNAFGESVVHTAARRGVLEVLEYLVCEANVSIKVCCDSGRNPLHDCCWTGRPAFECVQLILRKCPELLFIMDKRGFTPLEYIPRDLYQRWCEFLESHPHLIVSNPTTTDEDN